MGASVSITASNARQQAIRKLPTSRTSVKSEAVIDTTSTVKEDRISNEGSRLSERLYEIGIVKTPPPHPGNAIDIPAEILNKHTLIASRSRSIIRETAKRRLEIQKEMRNESANASIEPKWLTAEEIINSIGTRTGSLGEKINESLISKL